MKSYECVLGKCKLKKYWPSCKFVRKNPGHYKVVTWVFFYDDFMMSENIRFFYQINQCFVPVLRWTVSFHMHSWARILNDWFTQCTCKSACLHKTPLLLPSITLNGNRHTVFNHNKTKALCSSCIYDTLILQFRRKGHTLIWLHIVKNIIGY